MDLLARKTFLPYDIQMAKLFSSNKYKTQCSSLIDKVVADILSWQNMSAT